ncbi:MAG: hypothetical protein QM655_04145 [Nocardioidaceae bacterium]
MNDKQPADSITPEIMRSAAQLLDAGDLALLSEIRATFDAVDPVPEDLVERVQFALALDEVFTEVAELTRMPMDAMTVRGEPLAGKRTETLTFSAENLTVMITVTQLPDGKVRVDGWAAPPAPVAVRLRMQGFEREVAADESGRFVFDGVPNGFAQLSFRVDGEGDDGVIVTPLFEL